MKKHVSSDVQCVPFLNSIAFEEGRGAQVFRDIRNHSKESAPGEIQGAVFQ